jgi:hypothetical protein
MHVCVCVLRTTILYHVHCLPVVQQPQIHSARHIGALPPGNSIYTKHNHAAENEKKKRIFSFLARGRYTKHTQRWFRKTHECVKAVTITCLCVCMCRNYACIQGTVHVFIRKNRAAFLCPSMGRMHWPHVYQWRLNGAMYKEVHWHGEVPLHQQTLLLANVPQHFHMQKSLFTHNSELFSLLCAQEKLSVAYAVVSCLSICTRTKIFKTCLVFCIHKQAEPQTFLARGGRARTTHCYWGDDNLNNEDILHRVSNRTGCEQERMPVFFSFRGGNATLAGKTASMMHADMKRRSF